MNKKDGDYVPEIGDTFRGVAKDAKKFAGNDIK
jgi:hypothetical protein